MKPKKFKKKWKKSEKWTIGTLLFLFFGSIVFAIGWQLSGHDLIAWLGSSEAFFWYFALLIIILYIGWMVLLHKLRGGSDE